MAAALVIAAQARASLFEITFTSNDGNTVVSASVDGTLEGAGVYAATDGTIIIPVGTPFTAGTYNLIPNPSAPNAVISPDGYFIYDDLVRSGRNPFLTNPGLLFGSGDNEIEINLFSNGASSPVPNGTYQLYENSGANVYGNATISPVPEPTTMTAGALLLLPFGASTLRVLRRRTA